MKVAYFDQALRKDADFYDTQNPNEMASKIAKEVSAVQRGTGEKIGNIMMSASSFILGYIAAFTFGWKLTLILLAGLPAVMLSGVAMGASFETGAIETMKAYAQSAGYAEQALQSIKIVQTYCNEMLELNNYSKYLGRAKAKQRKHALFQAFSNASLFGIIFCFYAMALYFGGYLRWNEVNEYSISKGKYQPYTGGQVVCVMFCVVFGAMQLGGAAPMIGAVAQGRVAAKLAYEVIDHKSKVDINSNGVKFDPTKYTGQIKFSNVNFKYPSRPDLQVLKDFSAVFESGKTTALVGPSGSGKSTIIQLMERFYNPESGMIHVDSTKIEDFDLRNFRQNVGYVGQEPVLFNTSIRENMKFAKPDATDEEIKEALINANAWTFIQKITTGLDTIVGGSAGSLSGGQKQRVAIARAFLKKPKILLLDEATSALDKVNEKIVQEAIDNYRKKTQITIIVIAHRLSTIRDADKIIVLVNGCKTEEGNHNELMERFPDGTYAEFCRKQAASEAQADEEPQD